MPPAQREALTQALAGLMDGSRELRFSEDPALIAGVRVSIGPWVLQANLAEELNLFGAAGGNGRRA
jgi:F-type H+-transporting ATPase subunit b